MELGTSALSLCTALGQNYLRRFPFDEQSQVVNFWEESTVLVFIHTGFANTLALRFKSPTWTRGRFCHAGSDWFCLFNGSEA